MQARHFKHKKKMWAIYDRDEEVLLTKEYPNYGYCGTILFPIRRDAKQWIDVKIPLGNSIPVRVTISYEADK